MNIYNLIIFIIFHEKKYKDKFHAFYFLKTIFPLLTKGILKKRKHRKFVYGDKLIYIQHVDARARACRVRGVTRLQTRSPNRISRWESEYDESCRRSRSRKVSKREAFAGGFAKLGNLRTSDSNRDRSPISSAHNPHVLSDLTASTILLRSHGLLRLVWKYMICSYALECLSFFKFEVVS